MITKKLSGIFVFFLYFFVVINLTAQGINYMKINITDIYVGMDLSDILDISDLSLEDRHLMIASPSQMWPYFIVESDGILFHVAYDNKNIVRAIFADLGGRSIKRFFTPEGVYIGMDYNDLLAAFPDIKFYRVPWWAYIAVLPSGWKIGIAFDYLSGKDFPKQGDKIMMIYKDWMTISPDARSVN